MIGLYQEPAWETVTALFLPETTDSLFLRLRPSHGRLFPNPRDERVADDPPAIRKRYGACIAGYDAARQFLGLLMQGFQGGTSGKFGLLS